MTSFSLPKMTSSSMMTMSAMGIRRDGGDEISWMARLGNMHTGTFSHQHHHHLSFLDAVASLNTYPCQSVGQSFIVPDLEIAIASPNFASLFTIFWSSGSLSPIFQPYAKPVISNIQRAALEPLCELVPGKVSKKM